MASYDYLGAYFNDSPALDGGASTFSRSIGPSTNRYLAESTNLTHSRREEPVIHKVQQSEPRRSAYYGSHVRPPSSIIADVHESGVLGQTIGPAVPFKDVSNKQSRDQLTVQISKPERCSRRIVTPTQQEQRERRERLRPQLEQNHFVAPLSTSREPGRDSAPGRVQAMQPLQSERFSQAAKEAESDHRHAAQRERIHERPPPQQVERKQRPYSEHLPLPSDRLAERRQSAPDWPQATLQAPPLEEDTRRRSHDGRSRERRRDPEAVRPKEQVRPQPASQPIVQSRQELVRPPLSSIVMSRKVVVVGDGACGKTCLLIVYTENRFPEAYVPTIFENYATFVPDPSSSADSERLIELMLWDTAGQEEYDRLRPLSYPEASIILVCFAVDYPASLANIEDKWSPEVSHFCPDVPLIIVANKIDLRKDSQTIAMLKAQGTAPITTEQGIAVAKRLGARYAECSARTGQGVREVFDLALREAIKTRSWAGKRRRKCGIL
ncbi:uncharacterized protein L969DRAFT_91137 [Mixia osmundae IAM 14324]|uniref:Uncharacterized protein n=1 Tax=Mixia osmundae (strain CBS 9802 / IAM 14324 / JCM 22182 / KY 12970) TaxID=764103 RepID=G7E4D1_MIXOS|nr:uncharacterized protein L969DRAFT_91137 [Mixia osmundae IAM 14324]KEI36292.1 hypothetical protein L969DRAFT_91137 [Mixia osmundae IAM 14324]GAA97691.1 hypothetical protein E5Q_04369 [Mixia osmundae IAM 14324]